MMRRRLKIAFLTLLGLVVIGMTSGILYLESESFAESVKRMISERSPQKLGVVGDFSNLRLYFFPPGIGIASPKIRVSKENVSQIPIDGKVEAKELRVSFTPIKLISGILEVSEVYVVGGAIQGTLYAEAFKTKPKKKEEGLKLNWRDLFELQINGFRLEDTYLNLVTLLPGANHEQMTTELVVKNLMIQKKRIEGRDGLISTATVNAVRIEPPTSLQTIPIKEANQLQWDIELTDQGLTLNPFTADLSGIRFRLDGAIHGNLLDELSHPQIEAEAQIHSDLSTFFLANMNDDHWGGSIEARAKLSAELKRPAETLKAQFTVQGSDLVWKELKARLLDAQGELDLSSKKLTLKSFRAQDRGDLKLSSTVIPLQFNEPCEAQVDLTDADIHWLGGSVASAVAPLEGKISGKIHAQFLPGRGKSWRLKTTDELSVDHFELNDQKHPILKPVLPIKLQGGVEVTPEGVDFTDLKVNLAKTALLVDGGVHPGHGGFGINGKGYVSLKEFNEIAGNEIRGEGNLEARVSGPSSNVLLDFFPHLKDASYLGLHFGNLDGKVTYDDGVSELRFDSIHANYQNTYYSLDQGFIDLSGGDDIKLPFDIHSGRLEDLAQVLDKLVSKVSWFPKSLKGEIHGTVSLEGKISTPRLKVLGEIEGSDWIWLGERARRVKMSVGFDQGTYSAKNVTITKTSGSLKGDIVYTSQNDSLKWNFSTENLSFLDIDFLDRLELPAKSKIDLKSHGEGPLDHLKSKTEGALTGTEFKGERFESSHVTIEIGESTLRANLSVFGDQLSSQIKYALIPKQPSTFRMDLNDFDFSPALLVLNPKLLDDPNLVGEISGHIDLDFLSTQSEFARGSVQIKKYQLGKTGILLSLEDLVNVPIQLGYFHFPPARLKSNQSILVMGGEGKRGDIDFSLRGNVDLSLAELVSSSISKVAGIGDADIRIHGPLKELAVNGDLKFSNSRVLMKWLQTPFEGVDGMIRFHQGLISIDGIDAYLGEAGFNLNGKIQTYTDRFPELDLKAQFTDNKIKLAPLDLVQVRGPASIRGTEPPYVISGNLEVPQALWSHSFGKDAGGATSRGDRFLPTDGGNQNSSAVFKLDLSVNAPQGFLVKNELMDAEFKGSVKISGAPDHPILLGEGQLVQGKVLFKDHSFVLESAKITFDDPYQMNPKFNASANTEVNQYKIRLLAYGSASSYKAEFSSTPFLTESDIFSLLASGYTVTDANRYQNKDRSYVSQGEAASLILNSMDFNKDVQNKTGFQFNVEEAVDAINANSVFKPLTPGENAASPKIVLKRQLGRNIWLSLGSTVGVGSASQKEVDAEYKLSQGVSALGVWNDTEDISSAQTRTSFGLDLKFNKRFK